MMVKEELLARYILNHFPTNDIETASTKARRILKCQNDVGVLMLACHDPDYPARLRYMGKDAPPLIHLSGNKDLLHSDRCVAIVGARCADRLGLNAAYWLARQFASEGYVIISGTMYAVQFALKYGSCAVYTVKYEKYNELSSRNKFLFDCGVA